MENSLSLLDGKILLVGLVGIILGWFIHWLIARGSNKQLLLQVESEVEAKSANIEALKHDLTLRERTISEQKDALADLNQELSSQAERIKSQEADVNDLTSKLELLDSSQSESGDAIAVLEDTVAGLEEQLSSEKNTIATLREKHTEEVSQWESNYASTAEQLASRDKINQELNSELATARELSEQLRLELAAKNDAAEKRAAPLNQLKDELAQLTQLRQNDRGELSNLQSSLSIWQARAEKAESQLTQARITIRDKQQSTSNPAAPDPSYEKLLLLKDQEISAQKSQTHEAQAKLLSVRESISVHEKELQELKEQSQKQLSESKREIASMERILEEQKLSHVTAAAELTKQRELLQERIESLTSQNAATSRKLTTADENLEALSERNNALLEELNQSTQKLRIQEEKLSGLISTNESTEAQLARTSAERETIKRNLDSAQRELHAKNNALAALNSTLAKTETALQHCQTELQAKPLQSQSENQAPKLHSSKPNEVDDLKQIKGVGPALEKMLNDLGIYQFSQLATLNKNEVAWVDDHIESFKGRIYRDEWVNQAKQLTSD